MANPCHKDQLHNLRKSLMANTCANRWKEQMERSGQQWQGHAHACPRPRIHSSQTQQACTHSILAVRVQKQSNQAHTNTHTPHAPGRAQPQHGPQGGCPLGARP
eukprot:1160437-Pelagomonas_calceolata.AAC.11